MANEQHDRALTAILAECSAISALVDRKALMITTLVTFNITAVTTVAGFIISGKANKELLLVLPVVTAALGLLVAAQDVDARTAESYLKNNLHPLVQKYTGERNAWVWVEFMDSRRTPLTVAMTRALPMGLIFPGICVATLALSLPGVNGAGQWVAWGMGVALTALLVTSWASQAVKVLLGPSADKTATRP